TRSTPRSATWPRPWASCVRWSGPGATGSRGSRSARSSPEESAGWRLVRRGLFDRAGQDAQGGAEGRVRDDRPADPLPVAVVDLAPVVVRRDQGAAVARRPP